MAKNSKLTTALKEYFGFETFKGNQEAIIENLLAERDTFVLMPTGGGKSLCYQLPARLMDGIAIVISPLIALMKNQVDAMRSYSEEDGIAHFMNSSLSKQAIEEVKKDVRSGRTKLLYVAPESLTKEENVAFLKDVPISFYAVDEAHCISEWGHDFRPEYRNIRPIINRIGERPIIALTATATPKVQHDIQKNLGMTDAAVFKSSFNRPNLYYEVRPKTKDVDREIIKFIKANESKSGIIYCLSRKKVEELAEVLRLNGIKALPYHAGMESAVRSANQDAFLSEDVDVIVATIAFGRKRAAPDVTAARASASRSTPARTSTSSRSSCRASPSRSRKSASSCCSRRATMPSRRCAVAAHCCTTSARLMTRTTAVTATTVSSPRRG